jgi:hypothetical protein
MDRQIYYARLGQWHLTKPLPSRKINAVENDEGKYELEEEAAHQILNLWVYKLE